MLANSTRERSRSPHNTNGSNSPSSSNAEQIDSNDPNSIKNKKENDFQQRLKSLKSFIQNSINETTNVDDQMKTLEKNCLEQFSDISIERIRRMIRSIFKLRKSHSQSNSSFVQQEQKNLSATTNENNKKSRSSSSSNLNATKTNDLISPSVSSLGALDTEFLRHAFSQQFRPSLDLSAYFSGATSNANGTTPPSPLFRPNFSPSNFLQSLTNATPLPPPPPPPIVSSHTPTNGNADSPTININKSSKSVKLSSLEANSIRVLVNAYREAASFLCRSADELEQFI